MEIDSENITLNVKLPLIIESIDYHEFDEMSRIYDLLDNSLVVEEVGFSAPFYIGVLYRKGMDIEKYKKQIIEMYDMSED